jgi:hypothetical protein
LRIVALRLASLPPPVMTIVESVHFYTNVVRRYEFFRKLTGVLSACVVGLFHGLAHE